MTKYETSPQKVNTVCIRSMAICSILPQWNSDGNVLIASRSADIYKRLITTCYLEIDPIVNNRHPDV